MGANPEGGMQTYYFGHIFIWKLREIEENKNNGASLDTPPRIRHGYSEQIILLK